MALEPVESGTAGSDSERKPRARRWLSLILTVVSVAALFAVFDVRAALIELTQVSPLHALFLCVAVAGSRVFRGYKWNVLLRGGGVQISHVEAVRLTFIGQFFAVWTPAAVGSDIYRAYALRREADVDVVVSSLVVERYFGLLAVVFVAGATLPWTLGYWLDAHPALVVPLLLTMAAIVVLLPILLLGRRRDESTPRAGIVGRVLAVRGAVQEYGARRGVLAWFFVLTLIEILSYVVIPFIALTAIDSPVSFVYLACAMPLVYLVLKIPLSIQDLGIQEGALVAALAPAGVLPAAAIAVSLLQRAAQWMAAVLPGALLWAVSFRKKSAAREVRRPAPGVAG